MTSAEREPITGSGGRAPGQGTKTESFETFVCLNKDRYFADNTPTLSKCESGQQSKTATSQCSSLKGARRGGGATAPLPMPIGAHK